MVRKEIRDKWVPVLAVVLAAGVIGCGGGGGGGDRGGLSPIGGSSSGGGTGLPGTTGQITSGGGTSGLETTTGSATDTTGTDGGVGTGSNTGATGSAGTTGSTDTTGTDAGSGTTGTDGSATTDGGTSAGTTGAGSPPSPSGALRPNAIYFGRYGDASVVSSILPDGTFRQDSTGGAPDVSGAVPDPDHRGETIYAASVNGLVGVYRGTTFNPASSVRLAPPVYDAVTTIQATLDGDVVVVASQNGVGHVILLTGGTVRTIDEADSATVSVDGGKVAYTKYVNSQGQLMLWTRATNATRALTNGGDALLPSFSKDGNWVLFSGNQGDLGETPWDLYQVAISTGTVERITDTPDVSELGACYNEARTHISYVGLSSDSSLSGLYVRSNASVQRLADDPDLNLATYWTSAQGRSMGTNPFSVRFQSLLRRR